MRLFSFLLLCLATAAAVAAIPLVRWWHAPAPVPDHATPLVATAAALFAGRTELAQRVRPLRDQWTSVDLIITAEGEGLPGAIELRIAAWPSREVIRTARRPAAEAPTGDPWALRPGRTQERWLTFGFEPIAEAAGREFVVLLSYPESEDVPGARLGTLVHYPSRYPPGIRQPLERNGTPVEGNLIMRLAAAGTHGLAIQQAGDNLARQQPYWQMTLLLPTALAGACAVLAAGLLLSLTRGGQAPGGASSTPTTQERERA